MLVLVEGSCLALGMTPEEASCCSRERKKLNYFCRTIIFAQKSVTAPLLFYRAGFGWSPSRLVGSGRAGRAFGRGRAAGVVE